MNNITIKNPKGDEINLYAIFFKYWVSLSPPFS